MSESEYVGTSVRSLLLEYLTHGASEPYTWLVQQSHDDDSIIQAVSYTISRMPAGGGSQGWGAGGGGGMGGAGG